MKSLSLKSLDEVYSTKRRKPELLSPLMVNIANLDQSELNRFYILISRSDGKIRSEYIKELQQHLASLPPPPQHRIRLPEDIGLEKTYCPRSHLLDQYFSHQIPGINDPTRQSLQELILMQKRLCEAARNGALLLNLSTRKLIEAFPDVPRGITLGTQVQSFDDIPRDYSSKLIKCPARFMESSVSIVLEHTDNIAMDLSNYTNPLVTSTQ